MITLSKATSESLKRLNNVPYKYDFPLYRFLLSYLTLLSDKELQYLSGINNKDLLPVTLSGLLCFRLAGPQVDWVSVPHPFLFQGSDRKRPLSRYAFISCRRQKQESIS